MIFIFSLFLAVLIPHYNSIVTILYNRYVVIVKIKRQLLNSRVATHCINFYIYIYMVHLNVGLIFQL